MSITDTDFLTRMEGGDDPTPEELGDLCAVALGLAAGDDTALGHFGDTGDLFGSGRYTADDYHAELDRAQEPSDAPLPPRELTDALRSYLNGHAPLRAPRTTDDPF